MKRCQVIKYIPPKISSPPSPLSATVTNFLVSLERSQVIGYAGSASGWSSDSTESKSTSGVILGGDYVVIGAIFFETSFANFVSSYFLSAKAMLKVSIGLLRALAANGL